MAARWPLCLTTALAALLAAGVSLAADSCEGPAPGCCPGFVAVPASVAAVRAAGAVGLLASGKRRATRRSPRRAGDRLVCVAAYDLDMHDHTLSPEVRSAIFAQRKRVRRMRRDHRLETGPPAPPKPASPPPAPPFPPTPPAPPPRPATPAQDWWGRIRDSPTHRDDFRMSEGLIKKCADNSLPVPVMDLPLSLDPETFRRLVHTQEDWSAQSYRYWMANRWAHHWKRLRQYLPGQLGDVIDANKPFPTCAVVGNSGNLLSAHFGRYIDSHHKVFRINKGPIKGFEHHIGSKTDYRLLNKRQFSVIAENGRSHRHSEKLPEDFNVTYLVSRTPPNQMVERIPQAMQHAEDQQKALKFAPVTHRLFLYSNHLLSSYMECMGKRGVHMGNFTSSTSGLMTVLLAMQLCDKVAVFGIGEPPLLPTTPYQYFFGYNEFHPRTTMHDHHNVTAEGILINALAGVDLLSHCTVGKEARACTGHGRSNGSERHEAIHSHRSQQHSSGHPPGQDMGPQAASRAVEYAHLVESTEEQPTDAGQGPALHRVLPG